MKSAIRAAVSILCVTFICSLSSCACNTYDVDGYLCSGPEGGSHSDFAPGVIDSAAATLGVNLGNMKTNGSYENVRLLARGEGKMGLVLEDTFKYAIRKGVADNDMELIAAAARLRVMMVAFYSDVYILVNRSSGINGIADLGGKTVSIAEENSGTYITAKTILDSYTFGTPPVYNNESTRTAIDRVANGTCDALIKVTGDPKGYFGHLKAGDNVKFIRAELYGEKVLYEHTGVIRKEDFPFQDTDIENNIRVRVLLVGLPDFDNKDMGRFLADIYEKREEYAEKYTDVWSTVSMTDSLHYFGESPYAWNLKCASYFTGIDFPAAARANLACGTVGGSTEEIGADLQDPIESELGMSLAILNTSGSPEMAINIFNGNAAMGIVIEDVYNYLNNLNTYYDQLTALSMRKVMPLFPEDCHLLVNTGSGISKMEELAGKKVCLCEKTSGTFIVARNVLKTYGFTKDNAPVYYFESPDAAIPKVISGEYDAMFKVSAYPYDLFEGISGVKLIPVKVKDGTYGTEYETRTIPGGTYAFQPGNVDGNIYVRGLLVASSAINDGSAGDLIETVYQTIEATTFPHHAEHWTHVTRAEGLEYFKKKPYGWSQAAAKYYLEKLGYAVKE